MSNNICSRLTIGVLWALAVFCFAMAAWRHGFDEGRERGRVFWEAKMRTERAVWSESTDRQLKAARRAP